MTSKEVKNEDIWFLLLSFGFFALACLFAWYFFMLISLKGLLALVMLQICIVCCGKCISQFRRLREKIRS